MNKDNLVFITGGHMTPAVAVAETLKKRGWEIGYVGRSHALEGDRTASQESIAAKKLGFIFIPLVAGRLQRSFTIHTIPSLLKVPIGFIQAFFLLIKYKPQIICSFGGYVALPIVFMATILRIPVVIHEQTRVTGLTNKILMHLAKKICISWPDLIDNFPPHKTVLTGNPIRNEIFTPHNRFEILVDKPLLYVTGGNQGAHQLNLLVEKSLETLLTHFSIIHQCGSAEKYQDFKRLSKIKAKMPKPLCDRYLPLQYVESTHIGWVYDSADLLFARSGANTVYEAILLKKAALYLPLPWSGAGEQQKNAEFVSEKGGAVIFDEVAVKNMTLVDQLLNVFKHRNEIQKRLQEIATTIPNKGAENVADVVESLL